jgi:hypothetical protein
MEQNSGSTGVKIYVCVNVCDEAVPQADEEKATASGSAARRGRVGRGLVWNEAECLALCHAAPVVCESPILGAEMHLDKPSLAADFAQSFSETQDGHRILVRKRELAVVSTAVVGKAVLWVRG